MKRLTPLVLLAVIPACDGGGGTDTPTVRSVTISTATPTVGVGQTVQLTASARLSDGSSSSTGISWGSLDQAVATVANGLVSGVKSGTARIVASAGGKADTVAVTVTAGGAACDPAALINLAVGGTATRTGAAAAQLCLAGGAGGAEFTLVGFNGSTAPASVLNLTVQASGNVAVVGPPSPSRAAALPAAAAGAEPDELFHLGLMRSASRDLSHLVGSARAKYQRSGARYSTAAVPPAVGDLLSLNVNSASACGGAIMKSARVEAVGTRAIVVADLENPAGGFTAQDYASIAATFDSLVYPINLDNFGAPADIDGNARVIIFYTRAVNELTPANVNYIVGGFFYARDLFPKTATPSMSACAASNEAEMFYMLAPDPNGVVNGNQRSVDYVKKQTIGTVGHEFQHLINASRRLFLVPGVSGDNWDETVWLNEGLSHIAEELLFYHSAGMSPRSNISLNDLRAGAQRVNAFNTYQGSNFGRFEEYLESPETTSPIADNDELATRGASWAFLRYAADRKGGTERDLWYNLVNSTTVGVQNLSAALGTNNVYPWLRDFNVGLYTDDAVATGSTLQHLSWNYRSIYPAIRGDASYPLRTHTLGATANTSLQAAGGAFFRVGAGAGGTAQVRFNTAASLPTDFTVTVVRTR